MSRFFFGPDKWLDCWKVILNGKNLITTIATANLLT
jgi:hypothetical protein